MAALGEFKRRCSDRAADVLRESYGPVCRLSNGAGPVAD